MRRICYCLFGVLTVLVAGQAAAADDWLDDMPSVSTVVGVVRQAADDQIRQYPQLASDPDFLPMRLIGTFVLLRWVMEFEIETQGRLSLERTSRMRAIADDYMQAEYLIGLGTDRRNGLVKNQCQKDGPNRADFRQFPSAEACHRYVTQKIISNVYASFNWRNAIFPLIFCDRAKVYLELMQNNILTLPAPIRSPAVVGEMPDGIALLGMRFCDPYGGDANGNGLCDGWEKPVDNRSAVAGAASTCAQIVMENVRFAPGKGLIVTLAKSGGKLGATASFSVRRSSRATIDTDKPFWTGDAKVESGTTPDAPLRVVLAQDVSFRPDPTKPDPDSDKPWLVVEVTSGRPPPPVSCGRPLAITDWSPERTHLGIALFGPYDNVGRAIVPAGYKALVLTGNPGESGFLILRHKTAAQPFVFYATAPVPATQASTQSSQPKFLRDDYRASILGALKDSCEELEKFTLSGMVHTHPHVPLEWPSMDNFSMDDFNQGIQMAQTPDSDFGGGVVIPHSESRGIFLIPRGSLQILMFIADPKNDSPFTPEERECSSLKGFLQGLMPDMIPDSCKSLKTLLSEKYDNYTDPKRQKEIYKYPESIEK